MTHLALVPGKSRPLPVARALDAERLFRRRAHNGGPVELWPLTIDGTAYLTDKVMLIRRDRLQGVTAAWSWIGQAALPHSRIRALAEALRDEPSPALPVCRFDPELVCALYLCGAGVRPLLGDNFGDVHAVVRGVERIGLAMPLKPESPGAVLGVVPGTPPWPTVGELEGNEWL